jgi:cysteine synthase B
MTAIARITELVGNTPLVRLPTLTQGLPNVEIWAKLEYFNPGGSVKDRAALSMLTHAISSGTSLAGKRVIDSTSGNTGIALAWIGAALGLEVTLVMPSNVSLARKRLTQTYGADLIYSDPLEGSDGAIRHARKVIDENPGRWFYPDQYSNPANPLAHYAGTAPEIWAQTQGRVTHFLAGLGTTGTLVGAGRRFREYGVQVISVEPAEPFHGLEGLKHLATSIVPPIYDGQIAHRKLSITTDDGWEMSERLLKHEGLAVGHSSGAAAAGALLIAKELAAANTPGVIATVFPDRADRYFDPVREKQQFDYKS